MTNKLAFWDASAILPLCVSQPQSPRAQVLYSQFEVIAWWASEVEMRSGLTRLRRMGLISAAKYQAARQLAEQLIRSWLSVHESPAIAPTACRLLELHPLRAADALQMAAALEACENNPAGFTFVTADQKLADAARQTGFSVEFL